MPFAYFVTTEVIHDNGLSIFGCLLKMSKLIKESGATPIFEGWDRAEYKPMLLDKIIATWGLPVAK